VLRLPVRADIEPGRTPNVDQIEFLRPLCITNHGETTCRVRPDVLTVDQGNHAFHGDSVGVLSVLYSPRDPTRLAVSLERFDDTMSVADARSLTEAASVVEDGCVKIPWSSDGVGTLRSIRGDITRADAGAWTFRPSPRICAATHVPGDDRVFDAPLPMTGAGTTALPATGLSGALITGTLRGPGAFSVVADGVVRMEWRP
jgi:hypothetical protein